MAESKRGVNEQVAGEETQSAELSVPLRITVDAVMARKHPEVLAERGAAASPASQKEVAVAEALASRPAKDDRDHLIAENENLRTALETRTVIANAVGMLMVREKLCSAEAFDVLRRASQRQNRKLRDLAAELVDAHERDTAGKRPASG